MTESLLHKLTDAVHLTSSQYEVIGLILLEHQPHALIGGGQERRGDEESE